MRTFRTADQRHDPKRSKSQEIAAVSAFDAASSAEDVLKASKVQPLWQERLLRSDKGPKDCVANGVIILRSDPAFHDNIRFDEMFSAVFVRAVTWAATPDWREWSDVDDIEFALWSQLRGVPLRAGTCADAVALVASHNKHHAVREYLDGLEWDKRPRLDDLLEKYFSAVIPTGSEAAATRYLQAVGSAWSISAVARAYEAGCKADHALILEGRQGILKSTAIRTLAGPAWFADEVSELGTKDSAQDLRGKWIIELSELSALRRSEVERVKAFLTRQVDHYRPSYGRRSQDFPRQCVFAGSTNSDNWLDDSENRRFWPVKINSTGPNISAIERDRNQIWAEAKYRYDNGEQWWLPPGAISEAARDEQDKRRKVDPWEEPIGSWMALQTVPRSAGDVLRQAIGVEPDKWTRGDEMRVAACLKVLGYVGERETTGERRRVYSKAAPA
jgi:putative DNA primase/helicase